MEDSDPSGATFGNICFRIARFLQDIRSFNHALGLLMHKDAKKIQFQLLTKYFMQDRVPNVN